jgi:hypothetical protein
MTAATVSFAGNKFAGVVGVFSLTFARLSRSGYTRAHFISVQLYPIKLKRGCI